jgi:hypothetical protein
LGKAAKFYLRCSGIWLRHPFGKTDAGGASFVDVKFAGRAGDST